ncbi:hypothetical protein HPB47_015971 [Ixodes persulcatus]|uniref:Uncharacterized protein n=1 Tax=Ixodes persulcatus TaxID=34615 RepID=A0AC60QT03_IXOPE|nr:hypothetical protein HPB47_015971 [Ixodes persulcatus]
MSTDLKNVSSDLMSLAYHVGERHRLCPRTSRTMNIGVLNTIQFCLFSSPLRSMDTPVNRMRGSARATTVRQRTTFSEPEVMSEECIPVELLTVEVEMPASPEPTRILEELLPALKSKLETMRPQEKHCALLLDEMQVTAGLDFDPTVKKPIGDSIDGAFLKDLVFSVIRICEDAGCYVDAVISDMGPSNKALWKKCGISAKRSETPVVSRNHPCAADTDRQLYFLADAPHVLKNIRGHLVRGQSIFLPDDIVAKYSLPTNEVSVVHIKALAEIDAARDLKLAPHLKTNYLDPSHFEKMNVSSAVAVLNHSVGAAIRVLHQLLSVHKFKFVLLGRLTQDALENLFSCVRSRNPVPRALEFKLTLRLIMLSQFFRPSRKGSYAIDDSADLLEFIEIKKAASKKNIGAADEFFFEDSFLEDGAPDIDEVETESLVYLSGYITHSVCKKYKLCDLCKEFLQTDPVEHSDSLLGFKSYRSQSQPNPLVRPSRHVFHLLQHADKVFRSSPPPGVAVPSFPGEVPGVTGFHVGVVASAKLDVVAPSTGTLGGTQARGLRSSQVLVDLSRAFTITGACVIRVEPPQPESSVWALPETDVGAARHRLEEEAVAVGPLRHSPYFAKSVGDEGGRRQGGGLVTGGRPKRHDLAPDRACSARGCGWAGTMKPFWLVWRMAIPGAVHQQGSDQGRKERPGHGLRLRALNDGRQQGSAGPECRLSRTGNGKYSKPIRCLLFAVCHSL